MQTSVNHLERRRFRFNINEPLHSKTFLSRPPDLGFWKTTKIYGTSLKINSSSIPAVFT